MPRRAPSRLAGPVPVRVVPLPSDKPPNGTVDARLLAMLSPLSQVLRTQHSESMELVAVGAAVPAPFPPPFPPSSDASLDALKRFTEAVNEGRPLDPRISRLIANISQRAKVVIALLQSAVMNELPDVVIARRKVEFKIVMASFRDDLTPEQLIALRAELTDMETRLSRELKDAGITPGDTMGTMVQAADVTLAIDEGALAAKFAQTTAQGREVVRKLAMRLSKAVSKAERRR